MPHTKENHAHCRCMQADCTNNHYANCEFCGKCGDKLKDTTLEGREKPWWMNKLNEILDGIDKTETEYNYGWWETSTGADFGEEKRNELTAFVSWVIQQTKERNAEKMLKKVKYLREIGRMDVPLKNDCVTNTYDRGWKHALDYIEDASKALLASDTKTKE